MIDRAYPWSLTPAQWRAVLAVISMQYGHAGIAIASASAERTGDGYVVRPDTPGYDITTAAFERLAPYQAHTYRSS